LAHALLGGSDVIRACLKNIWSRLVTLFRATVKASAVLGLLVSVFVTRSSDAATVRIGSEATLALPSSAIHVLSHGFVPDDGLVATNNPPLFNWVYAPSGRKIASDEGVYVFKFQLATNSSFSPLYWNITTSNNLYNFLSPITNADGTAFTGTSYWRIVYMNSNMTANVATSAVHHFSIAPTASTWNRAMLADTDYILSKTTKHPHLWFNQANSNAVGNYFRSGNSTLGAWSGYESYVRQVIAQNWWNNPNVFTNEPYFYGHAQEIATVALVYQLTADPALRTTLRDANPMGMLDLFAKQWMVSRTHNPYGGNDRVSAYIMNSGSLHAFALAYDFLCNDMSPAQRANVVRAFEASVQFYINEDWWFLDPSQPGTNRVYEYNKRKMHFAAGPKQGDGHSREDVGAGMMFCMAAYAESDILQNAFPFFLNFFIARHDHARMDEGTYRDQSVFYGTRNFPALIQSCILFPEADLARSPIVRYEAEHLAYFQPNLFRSVGEPWGDLPGMPNISGTSWSYSRWRQVARLTRSGAVLQQHNRAVKSLGSFVEESAFLDAASGFYYTTNGITEADWRNTYYLNLRDGWCISSSHQPSDFGAFTNAVRFVTQARPGIGRIEHAGWGDGSIQLTAYGAQISAGGAGFYKKHPMYHSAAVFVDGVGIQAPMGDPAEDWYSRFIAFTNTDDFTYVASDTTKAYNRKPFTVPTAAYNDASPYYNTHKVPYLTSMHRHIAFPRKKYVVLYDTMTATQACNFQWLWHVLEPTATVNNSGISFSFTSTNHYNGSNVTTYVQHVVSPTLMGITNIVNTALKWPQNYKAFYNPFTSEIATNPPDIYSAPTWSHSIWVYNKTKTTNWHFLSVVYPVKWGESAPTITRLDDLTVRVQKDGDDDIISFDPATKHPATMIISAVAESAVATRPTAPNFVRITP
jgi:hypothetical protein